MVETTRHREFPLGDGGEKLVATYTEARALSDLGKPKDEQLVDYKLATVQQIDARLTEVKNELEQIKANELAEKEKEKDEPKDPKAKKPKKDDKKPELTKKIKELEDLKKATDGKPKTLLTVTFKDGSSRVFQVGGSVFGPSGDRYVMEQLKETGGMLGGETSGHLLCLDCTTTGDALISALQVLAIMKETGASLAELAAPMPKYPQVLENVRVAKKIDP
jgi:hypothetical protein